MSLSWSNSFHSVQFSPFYPLDFYSVQFNTFGLIQSTSIPFGPHWSHSVYFNPFSPLRSYLVHSIYIGSIWSYSVHIGRIQSIMSTLIHFSPDVAEVWRKYTRYFFDRIKTKLLVFGSKSRIHEEFPWIYKEKKTRIH